MGSVTALNYLVALALFVVLAILAASKSASSLSVRGSVRLDQYMSCSS